jgi:hypothetical protein
MIRPLAYFFFLVPIVLASVVFGAWFLLFLVSKPVEALLRVPFREFLGPGGPDDPFADENHEARMRLRRSRNRLPVPKPVPALDGKVSLVPPPPTSAKVQARFSGETPRSSNTRFATNIAFRTRGKPT